MNGLNKKNKIEFSIMLNRIEKVQVSPDDECSDALVGIETFIVSDRDADRKRHDTTGAENSYPVDKQKKNTILLLILVLIALSPSAQRILTLEEAIANTLQKNYDIVLSKNDSAIAAIDYSYRNAAFIP